MTLSTQATTYNRHLTDDSAVFHEVNRLLIEWRSGDAAALTQLTPMLYNELRTMARRHLRKERPDHTLQPTALVHEVYFRLIEQTRIHWQNRSQFFAVVSLLMRRILVDHARAYCASKRNGQAQKLSLDACSHLSTTPRPMDLLALDDALNQLAEIDPLQSKVVELRYFTGLTIEETAEALDISAATVKRYWFQARLWLKEHLSD